MLSSMCSVWPHMGLNQLFFLIARSERERRCGTDTTRAILYLPPCLRPGLFVAYLLCASGQAACEPLWDGPVSAFHPLVVMLGLQTLALQVQLLSRIKGVRTQVPKHLWPPSTLQQAISLVSRKELFIAQGGSVSAPRKTGMRQAHGKPSLLWVSLVGKPSLSRVSSVGSSDGMRSASSFQGLFGSCQGSRRVESDLVFVFGV